MHEKFGFQNVKRFRRDMVKYKPCRAKISQKFSQCPNRGLEVFYDVDKLTKSP